MKEAWKPWIRPITCCVAAFAICVLCMAPYLWPANPWYDTLQKPAFAPKGMGQWIAPMCACLSLCTCGIWAWHKDNRRIVYALLAQAGLLPLWAYALLGLCNPMAAVVLMTANCLCALYLILQAHASNRLCLWAGLPAALAFAYLLVVSYLIYMLNP